MVSIEKVPTVVMLSGSGRTLENFLDRMRENELPIAIRAVVSSRPDVRGVQVAREAGLEVGVFRRRDYEDSSLHNAAINAWLKPHAPRLILLAGYLCYYQRADWFDGRILNIHPALLPAHGGKGFYGDRVHEAVLAAGERESGCTVHEVSDIYDGGKILGQRRVPVLPDDSVATLSARVFAAECELYPGIVAGVAAELLG